MPAYYQSETGKIKRLILKQAKAAFLSQSHIDEQWKKLNYLSPPDFDQAKQEYQLLIQLLEKQSIELHYLSAAEGLTIDSIYCRDASVLCNDGAILCQMGKIDREGEPKALAALYQKLAVPILGHITGNGRLEGGDTCWIDPDTLAVGRGYRTNDEGIAQLKDFAKGRFQVVVVPLPHYKGPSDVFHLMSILSPIDDDLFLVYSSLMPVPFREMLLARGIQLVEVPEEEFESMGINVLALAPRKCLMLAGNPITKQRLAAAGVTVFTYQGTEISGKGCGGPTCLTRPLERMN